MAGDATLIEPNRPHIVRQNFSLPRWPERMNGFTVVLLSDFHYDPFFSVHPLRAAVPLVKGLNPDLIVLAGDFVTAPIVGDDRKAALAAEPCAHLLHEMTAPHGLWAILGNHDADTGPKIVTGALQAEGIQVLANQPLYTTCGLGTVGLPMRLNCPPEITLLTLNRAAGREPEAPTHLLRSG